MKTVMLLISFLIFSVLGCNQTSSSYIRLNDTTNDAVIANINLGVEYMRRGDYERSLIRLERARNIDPNYFETYNYLGLLYQTLKDEKEAERNFKKAIKLNGNDSSALNNYGQFLCQIKRREEAEEFFLRAANNPLYKTPEVAITNAGLCVLFDDNKIAAEKYFRRALEYNPRIPDPLIRMAQLSHDKENYLSARAYLQRYLEVARQSASSLWLGIQIELKQGDRDAVSSYALMLRNQFPESEEAELLLTSGIR